MATLLVVMTVHVHAEFRSSKLSTASMSTIKPGSLPFSQIVASSEPLVERVTSKRFLSGKDGTVDTVMQLNAILTKELAGSLERNKNLVNSVFPDTSFPFWINVALAEKLVPSRLKNLHL